jgi:hypothetical protein
MLFHVYNEQKPDGYFVHEPVGIYRASLDSDWIMYLLLPALFIVVAIALMYAWHWHELPKHKADSKKMRQAELVSALTLLGLFEHWVWAVALFIAYTDWNSVEDFWISILKRSRASMDNTQEVARDTASSGDETQKDGAAL